MTELLSFLVGVLICVAFPSVPEKIRAAIGKLSKGGGSGEGPGQP
jgi:hypothetical protein